jgi:hypothetical protein
MKTRLNQVLIVAKTRSVQSGQQAKQKGLSEKSQQLFTGIAWSWIQK